MSKFTQKHYEAIAKILKRQRPEVLDNMKPTYDLQELWEVFFGDAYDKIDFWMAASWIYIVEDFIESFKTDNIKFNQPKFEAVIWSK